MHALAILLAIPLLGGLLLWALGERESAPEANAAFSFATFVAAAWVTADVVSTMSQLLSKLSDGIAPLIAQNPNEPIASPALRSP